VKTQVYLVQKVIIKSYRSESKGSQGS